MSTHASDAAHAGGTLKTFNMVWIALLVMTGIEVFLAYIQLPTLMMLTSLMGLSVVKAVLIIAYFMHLKFERLSLFMTLFPMLILCILLLFSFMPDAQRAMQLRTQ